MKMKVSRKTISLFSAACIFSSQLAAAPTMFVKEKTEDTWEASLKLVPTATRESGVSVDDINNFVKKRLAERAVSSPLENYNPICLMNFARAQDISSSDRVVQEQIRENLEEYPRSFSDSWSAHGENFQVRVGIFEECKNSESKDDTPITFMALVITDSVGTLREFDSLSWEFIRIFKREDGGMNILGCFACGEVQELRYNPSDKEFYYKWIGH